MAKKQTKADKAFIEKISSITVGTGAGKQEVPHVKCPDCGGPAALVGIVGFPIYAGDVKAEVQRRRKKADADEDSFAA